MILKNVSIIKNISNKNFFQGKELTMSSDSLYVFKVIVAGNSGVGKTCLVQRFIDKRFNEGTKATIGVDFSLKNVTLDEEQLGSSVALQIWDMAGENRFRSILPYYIAGTQGLILAFDSTNPPTLTYLNEWLEVVDLYLTEKIPVILISTKHDLPGSNNTAEEDIESFKKQNGISYYIKTSSKEGTGVDSAFEKLTQLIAKEKGLIN